MGGTTPSGERISFSTSTWVTLIGLVGTGVGTNLILIYSLSGNLQDRIDVLDQRWQDRIMQISKDFRQDMQTLESRIPPTWFRSMVEKNASDIKQNHRDIIELEDEFSRDFVRHTELQTILDRDKD